MSSKKTTTEQHQTSNQTTTPEVPDWLLNPAQNIAGQLGGLLGGNASQYTPGMSDLQKQANTAASNLTPSSRYGDAATAVGNVGDVQGQSVLDNLSAYESPYRDSVLNPVLADFDANAGTTRAAQAAAAARGGAFGGSRYGVAQSQTEDALARGRASTEGGLLKDLYGQAASLSEADTGRRQQAALANQAAGLSKAGLLTNIGGAESADARANLALQGQFGEDATNIENQARQYPLQYQAQLEGLLGGLNTAQYSGQNQTGVQDSKGTQTVKDPTGQLLQGLGSAAQLASLFTPAGPLMGLAGAAGGASGFLGALGAQGANAGAQITSWSDRRLKRDVTRVGQRADGLPLYAFRYLWDRVVRFGVMAQDVLAVKPEAVIPHPSGYLMVDYGALA